MPWREVSIMDERREFIWLAMQEGANRRELCRRFGIHPTPVTSGWVEEWPGRSFPIALGGRIRARREPRR